MSEVDFPRWVQTVLTLGGVGVALAYLFSIVRKGQSDAWEDIASALEKKMELQAEYHKDEMNKLGSRLNDAIREKEFLAGQVTELSKKNEVLEALIVGDQVPTAMREAMEAIATAHHAQTRNALVEVIRTEMKGFENAVVVAMKTLGMDFRDALDEFLVIARTDWKGAVGEQTAN